MNIQECCGRTNLYTKPKVRSQLDSSLSQVRFRSWAPYRYCHIYLKVVAIQVGMLRRLFYVLSPVTKADTHTPCRIESAPRGGR